MPRLITDAATPAYAAIFAADILCYATRHFAAITPRRCLLMFFFTVIFAAYDCHIFAADAMLSMPPRRCCRRRGGGKSRLLLVVQRMFH